MRLLALVVPLLLCAALTAQGHISSADRTKMRETRETMRGLAQDIRAWADTHEGKYPEKLSQIVEAQLREELPKDAWDADFLYATDPKDGYKLTSLGSDKKLGGEGAAADIVWTRSGESIVLSKDQQQELDRKREAARHEARITVARKQMVVAGLEALKHRKNTGAWPTQLEEVRRTGESAADKAVNACFGDPWGHPYELRVLPKDNIAVVCWGEDGAEGGLDRAADFVIAEREIRAHLKDQSDYDPWSGMSAYYDWRAQSLAQEIQAYKQRAGKLPEKLEELGQPLPGEEGKAPAIQFDGIPLDRWGNEYIYLRLSDEHFAIVGLGKDAKSGGVKDEADYVYPIPGAGDGSMGFGRRGFRRAGRAVGLGGGNQNKADKEKADALVEVANEQMANLVEKLKALKDETGKYPDKLETIAEKMPGGEIPKDPWDRDFVYALADDGTFTLKCLGSDGAEGGEGAAADIVYTADGKKEPEPATPPSEEEPVATPEPMPE